MRLDRRTDEFESFPERNDELELPDDLAAMAEQLADDAQRLAACYPPRFGPVIDVAAVTSTRQRTSSKRRVWLVSSLAGGLLALGLVTALVLSANRTEQPDAHAMSRQVARNSSHTLTPALSQAEKEELTEPGVGDLVLPAAAPDVPLQVTPAVFQRGVTSPEMEGWLDLAMDTESIEF